MSDWFYASGGQQHGPHPETQLRELIARGAVTTDTLVWTEGMADWQRAGEIPGLISGTPRPPAASYSGRSPMSGDGGSGGSITADLGVWALFWRILVFMLGVAVIIPAPWASTMFCRWFVSRLHVPNHPELEFTGRPLDLWWLWAALAVSVAASFSDYQYLGLLTVPVQLLVYWFLLRWFVAHLSSGGRPLSLAFEGGAWAWIGWQILLAVSVFTIIGWAWVATAWTRWIGRTLAGTRRELVFRGSGLEVLWRTLVLTVAMAFVIPIPWALAWYYRWYVSQFALTERAARANA